MRHRRYDQLLSMTEDRQNSEPRVSTGIEGLDNILNGGLPEDHLYLVEGDPGSGKLRLRAVPA